MERQLYVTYEWDVELTYKNWLIDQSQVSPLSTDYSMLKVVVASFVPLLIDLVSVDKETLDSCDILYTLQ